MKAMAQDPDQRYLTVQAMLVDMDEFRKDPTILFDYNNSSTGLDDATKIHSTAQVKMPNQTTAEKTAARSGAAAPQRPVRQPAPKPAVKNKKRREEIVEERDRGGKIAAVAVVLCSIVAIVAIGVFIYMLLGQGDHVNPQEGMVTVPNLVNRLWDDVAAEAVDYKVEIELRQYSDIYDAGRIISQKPDANTKIEKGSTVTVVVSYGPEPKVKLMVDLVNLPKDTAINFLVNTQGVSKDRIFCYEENNAEVPAGSIIRTDPVEGEELPENGEPIKLYISLGPVVKKVTMVDLTSDFYNEDSALKWLDMNGFQFYSVQYVESEKPAGKIVSQSVAAGETVDVNTVVVLLVSRGGETQPTAPPVETTDPEDYVSKLVQVELPVDITEPYLISIYRDGVLIEERDIPVGTLYSQFNLTGKGVMNFEVRLSTGAKWTLQVDFDAPDEPVPEESLPTGTPDGGITE